MRSTRHTPHPRKMPSQLSHQWVKCDYRPQATGSDIQERCSKPITQASKNSIKNTPVKHKNTIILYKPGP